MSKLNDSIIEEALKIISINKSKANTLRLSLLKDINYESSLNLKIRQYLGEIEYDLNILYDIIKEFKISYDNGKHNLNYSINMEKDESRIIDDNKDNNNENKKHLKTMKKSNSLKLFNKYKNKFFLTNLNDNFDDDSRINNNNGKKIYNLTINICDDRNFITDKKKENTRKIHKSNSCKSFLKKRNKNKMNCLINDNFLNSKRPISNREYANVYDKENSIYNNDNSIKKKDLIIIIRIIIPI